MLNWAVEDLSLSVYPSKIEAIEIWGEDLPDNYEEGAYYDSSGNIHEASDLSEGYEDDLRYFRICSIESELEEMRNQGLLYNLASQIQDAWYKKSDVQIIDLTEEEE
jgi:hypothetical protein